LGAVDLSLFYFLGVKLSQLILELMISFTLMASSQQKATGKLRSTFYFSTFMESLGIYCLEMLIWQIVPGLSLSGLLQGNDILCSWE
jgi:hypothetical protein